MTEERVGDWIQTRSGRAFWPLDPKQEEVWINDIAHALSNQCRFGGHCKPFLSVAEHCVNVASAAPDNLKLQALMHDSAEAYLVDLPRPIKRYLTDYSKIEEMLLQCIFSKYNIQYPINVLIHTLDNRILITERNQVMKKPPIPWKEEAQPLDIKIECWAPEKASLKFMKAFFKYKRLPRE